MFTELREGKIKMADIQKLEQKSSTALFLELLDSNFNLKNETFNKNIN
jgi:hypothetical protein